MLAKLLLNPSIRKMLATGRREEIKLAMEIAFVRYSKLRFITAFMRLRIPKGDPEGGDLYFIARYHNRLYEINRYIGRIMVLDSMGRISWGALKHKILQTPDL